MYKLKLITPEWEYYRIQESEQLPDAKFITASNSSMNADKKEFYVNVNRICFYKVYPIKDDQNKTD